MIDGTYNVSARTPLGAKAGTLVMATNGTTCDADLTIAGKTKHLVGSIDGETVTFEGSIHLPFPIGNVRYVLSGTVKGDTLSGTCRTKKFSFDVQGTRVA
ncbi:MAG: hypothetical protein Q4A07_05885 [Coriobacteriales bacterium]|nr:hypothetical protein [Coriobacteriales bacterium]